MRNQDKKNITTKTWAKESKSFNYPADILVLTAF